MPLKKSSSSTDTLYIYSEHFLDMDYFLKGNFGDFNPYDLPQKPEDTQKDQEDYKQRLNRYDEKIAIRNKKINSAKESNFDLVDEKGKSPIFNPTILDGFERMFNELKTLKEKNDALRLLDHYLSEFQARPEFELIKKNREIEEYSGTEYDYIPIQKNIDFNQAIKDDYNPARKNIRKYLLSDPNNAQIIARLLNTPLEENNCRSYGGLTQWRFESIELNRALIHLGEKKQTDNTARTVADVLMAIHQPTDNRLINICNLFKPTNTQRRGANFKNYLNHFEEALSSNKHDFISTLVSLINKRLTSYTHPPTKDEKDALTNLKNDLIDLKREHPEGSPLQNILDVLDNIYRRFSCLSKPSEKTGLTKTLCFFDALKNFLNSNLEINSKSQTKLSTY